MPWRAETVEIAVAASITVRCVRCRGIRMDTFSHSHRWVWEGYASVETRGTLGSDGVLIGRWGAKQSRQDAKATIAPPARPR